LVKIKKGEKMKSQRFILFLIIAALALIGLTSCTITIHGPELALDEPPEEPASGEPSPGEVQSITFTADRTDLRPGECATLQWSVEGGYGVFLNGEPVQHAGERRVCPEETNLYTLEVDTGETMEWSEVVIMVEGEEQPPEEPPPPGEEPPPPGEEPPPPGEEPPPPGEEPPPPGEEPPPPEEHPPEEQPPEGEGIEFINLVVEPDVIPLGGCAMLFWEVVPPGEWLILLNGQEVPHAGEREVCPGDITTYELLVEAPGGPQVRTVTLHVEGEPEPGQPPEPTPAPPAGPTPTPAPPAGPTPTPGVVIDFWVDNNSIAAGTCTTLRWHVANANAVHLDGAGVVGDGSKQICPSSTTVYVLHVAHDAGATEKKVTVKVSGSSSTPTPTPGGTPSFSTDLALTDLYPDKLKNGTVYGRITNRGPGTCKNVQIQFSCSWIRMAYGATLGLNQAIGPQKITITSLSPGQTASFNTGISVDITQFWYDMTCQIHMGFNDPDPGNNGYKEKLAK
jgi:hypothetical protein